MIPDFIFNLYRGCLKLTGRDVVEHPVPFSPTPDGTPPSLNEKTTRQTEVKPANRETIAELELTRRQKDYYLRQLLQRFGYGARTGTAARIRHFEFNVALPDLLPQLEALYEFQVNLEVLLQAAKQKQQVELHRLPGFRAVDLAAAAAKCSESRTLLLFVEPLAGRTSGSHGRVKEDRRVILLEPKKRLSRINPGLDTIYISPEAEAGRETLNYLNPVYRIMSVKGRKIELDRPLPLSLGSDNLRWNIPAGFGCGLEPELEYKFDPGCRPHSHYDGVLFIIRDGCVVASVRASAGMIGVDDENLPLHAKRSGIRELDVVSHAVAGNARLNYAFSLLDVAEADEGANRYFLCHGNRRARGSGSRGWLHSPDFACVRDELIRAYADEQVRGGLEPDGSVLNLLGLDQRAARARFHRERRKGLDFWNGSIRSRLVILSSDHGFIAEDDHEI